MARPTLDERFEKGPPTRNEGAGQRWLTKEEQRFILWGLKEGWAATRIGTALGVHEASVRRFRKKYWRDPEALLDLELIEMTVRSDNNEFRCLVCGDRVLTRREAERHLVGHYVDKHIVDAVLPAEKPEKGDDEEGW